MPGIQRDRSVSSGVQREQVVGCALGTDGLPLLFVAGALEVRSKWKEKPLKYILFSKMYGSNACRVAAASSGQLPLLGSFLLGPLRSLHMHKALIIGQ